MASVAYKQKLPGFPKVPNVSAYPTEKSSRGNEYASGRTQRLNPPSYPTDRTTGKGSYAECKYIGEKFNSYPSGRGKAPEIAKNSYADLRKEKADEPGHKQSQGTRATIVRMGQHETVKIK